MAETMPQNYSNHRRLIPLYHGGVLGAFTLNAIRAIWHLIRSPGASSALDLLMAAALIVLFFYARIMALTVQDRLIRLEERLRMERLLPADLKPRIEEFTPRQLVALRFASDGELPELARKVLDEKLTDADDIKRMVKNWRPDYLRV